MVSSFHGIELGKKGLLSHQSALSTTGHNLANVSNPEYTRQKVQLGTVDPIHPPGINSSTTSGQIGGGTKVEDVRRVRDIFLDDRILSEHGLHGYWKERDYYFKHLENILNEPNTPSIQSNFSKFIKSWNDLANNPKEGGAREVVRREGIGLTRHIRATFTKLYELRQSAEKSLQSKVAEVNVLSEKIASYNIEIRKVEAEGHNPNDLYDKRDGLVDRLSKVLPIRVGRVDKDEYIIYLGSERLVQGERYEKLITERDSSNEGFSKIKWAITGEEIILDKRGEIAGLIRARDIDIKGQIIKLDKFAINLIEVVNDIHREGFGLNFKTGNNFFKEKALALNVNSNYDLNQDEQLDSSAIYKITGQERVSRDSIVGVGGELNLGLSSKGEEVIIRYSENDTVGKVLERINKSEAELVSYINHKGKVVLKSTREDNMIMHLEDTNNFLVGLTGILRSRGSEGAFDRGNVNEVSKLIGVNKGYAKSASQNPSGWIVLDDAILGERGNIAAARGIDTDGDGGNDKVSGESDGRNALRIVAALRSEGHVVSDDIEKLDHEPVHLDKDNKGFNSYLISLVKELGKATEDAGLAFKKEDAILENLTNARKGISGVNIDEEMAALVMYQHGYNASARFVTHVDRMLDTIINRMGV